MAVAILSTLAAQAIGPNYATVFGIHGTQSQEAKELLERDFRAQSGDADTIMFHVAQGTVVSPRVRAAITPLL